MGEKTAGVGHFTIPTAPAAGTSCTSGAANVFTTTYVQLSAAAPAAIFITGIYVEQAAVAAGTYIVVQLATGVAASEVIVGQHLIAPVTGSTVARCYKPIYPPIPVANGIRIACKTADSVGALASLITLECINQSNVVDDGVAVGTVTTVTNQLTAAAIATGVWQDTTAGDFTVAGSVGKSVYTSGNIPGAAGGHFIAGTNAATTITTALTTTFTGNLTGSVGSVTGAVGSVTGAVGSVTGAVGSVTAGVTVTTNNDKTGYGLSAAAVQAIWDALTSALTTVNSIGKLLVTNIDAAISSRMATYTQPTGFLAATFPAGTVANTTNITAGTITTATNLTNAPTVGDLTAAMKTSVTTAATAATPIAASVTGAVGSVTGNVGGNVTGSAGSVVGAVGSVTGNVGGNVVGSVASVTAGVTLAASQHVIVDSGTVTTLTNLPAITAGWLTASGIAAAALNGKGDWNIGKTGYSLTQTFPSNFAALAITAGGAVTAGTVSDKTGYSLTQAFPANFAARVISAAGVADSNIKSVAGTTVNGNGAAGTPWGP